MITILKQPEPIAFTKNTVEFKVESNMQYHTPKVVPYMKIDIVSRPVMGEHLNFSFTNPITQEPVTIHMVATINYQDTYCGIPIASFTTNNAVYASKVAEILRGITDITTFYDIVNQGTSISLQAKYAKEELVFFDVNTNANTYVRWNITQYKGVMEPQQRDGYSMKALVYFEDHFMSGEFRNVAVLNLFSDAENGAQIDIAQILDVETEIAMKTFPVPYIDQVQISSSTILDISHRYYVAFTESWNGFNDEITTKSDVFTSIWAGISTNDELIANPFQHLTSEPRFLTWWPSGKETYQDSLEYLSVINTGFDFGINNFFTVKTYTNLTSYTSTIAVQLPEFGAVRTFDCSYQQRMSALNGSLAPNEHITHWDVWIGTTTYQIIKPYRFYLGKENCFQKQLLFFNSFGCPETLNIVDWEETVEISKQLVTQSKQFDQHRLKPQNFVFDDEFINAVKIETNRLTQDEMYHMQSLLLSGTCFVIERGRYVPAVLQVDKKQVLIESEFSNPINLELIMGNSNQKASFYSYKPTVTATVKCGIVSGTINTNGIHLEEALIRISNDTGDLSTTPHWIFNSSPNTDGVYPFTMPAELNDEGVHVVEVTLYAYNGIQHQVNTIINYEYEEMAFEYDNFGAMNLAVQFSATNQFIYIDWGIGFGFETYQTATGTNTLSILKNIVTPGIKKARLRAKCFDAVSILSNNTIGIKSIELQKLNKLTALEIYYDSYQEKYYLNGINNLNLIIISNSFLAGLEIGYKPFLARIAINSCSEFNTAAIDELIAEIWSYRAIFFDPGNVNVTFTNLTDTTFSAQSLEIINGTGAYVGQGLNSDYGMNITIS